MPFSVSKIICIRLYYNRECNILTILFLLLMSWQVFETTDVQPNSRRLFLIKLQDTSIPKTSNNFLCNTCVVSSLFLDNQKSTNFKWSGRSVLSSPSLFFAVIPPPAFHFLRKLYIPGRVTIQLWWLFNNCCILMTDNPFFLYLIMANFAFSEILLPYGPAISSEWICNIALPRKKRIKQCGL